MFRRKQQLELNDMHEVRAMAARRETDQPWFFARTAMWHASAFVNARFRDATVFIGVTDDGVVEGFPVGNQTKHGVLCRIEEAAAETRISPPIDPAVVQMQWSAVRVVAEQGKAWDGEDRYVYVLSIRANVDRLPPRLFRCANPMRSISGLAAYIRAHGHTRVLLPDEVEQIQAGRVYGPQRGSVSSERARPKPVCPPPARRDTPEPVSPAGATSSRVYVQQVSGNLGSEPYRTGHGYVLTEEAVLAVLLRSARPLTDREVTLIALAKDPQSERADPRDLKIVRAILKRLCDRHIATRHVRDKPRYTISEGAARFAGLPQTPQHAAPDAAPGQNRRAAF